MTVRPAVEKLERGDLGFVLFNVVAERLGYLLSVLRRLLCGAGEKHAVAGGTSITCSLGWWTLIKSWRSAGLVASGATASCISLAWAVCKSFSVGWKYWSLPSLAFASTLSGLVEASRVCAISQSVWPF